MDSKTSGALTTEIAAWRAIIELQTRGHRAQLRKFMHDRELRDVAKQARNVADLIRQRPVRDLAVAAGNKVRPDARLKGIEGLLVRVAIEVDEYLARRRR